MRKNQKILIFTIILTVFLTGCNEIGTKEFGDVANGRLFEEKGSDYDFSGIDSIDQVTDSTAIIYWINHADASAYEIYNVTSGTTYVDTVSAPISSYELTGLNPLTSYMYRVRAIYSDGYLDSNTKDVSFTTNLAPNPPSGLSLQHPSTTPNFDDTPTIRVSGVKDGDTINLFTDSSCSSQVASAKALGNTVDITTPSLVDKAYTLYANATNSDGNASNCSSATVSYTLLPLPLLDQYPGAAFAYSLRKLSNNTINVVRVRRNSDNAEQDFTATEVSDGTLVSWVGGSNDGYVTTWYDQSGNNNDAIQATPSMQPRIVDAGAMVTENGKAALEFDGSNDYFDIADTDYNLNDALTVITVLDFTTPGIIIGHYNTTLIQRSWQLSLLPNNRIAGIFSNDGADFQYAVYNLASTGQLLNFTTFNIDNPRMTRVKNWENKTESDIYLVHGDISENFLNSTTNLSIGAANTQTSAGSLFDGKMQSIIVFPSDQLTNRSEIEANINSYYNIY